MHDMYFHNSHVDFSVCLNAAYFLKFYVPRSCFLGEKEFLVFRIMI